MSKLNDAKWADLIRQKYLNGNPLPIYWKDVPGAPTRVLDREKIVARLREQIGVAVSVEDAGA